MSKPTTPQQVRGANPWRLQFEETANGKTESFWKQKVDRGCLYKTIIEYRDENGKMLTASVNMIFAPTKGA